MRLPTEQEWEYAARGMKGREYPWGDKFDFNRANAAPFWKQDNDASYVSASSGASTSLVGQFDGVTLEGIADLSGNVWEWTSSWYENEQVNRTLRGGSWLDSRGDLRAAARYWFVPDFFSDFIGFRLLSPGSVSGS